MTKLAVAIVGFGWWGRHMLARLSSSSMVRPIVVVDPSDSGAGAAKAAGVEVMSYPDAINSRDIDGVILTVPNELHELMAIEAVRAGKHVFCEKPLALQVASAKRIVKACEAAGVMLGIGHERRFEPAMQQLEYLVRSGELGTIMHVEAAFSHDKLINVPLGDWRTRKDTAPGAGMTATGIHLTDLFIWMFGRVRNISALTAARVLPWETGDTAAALLRFESGATATLQAVLHTPHFIRYHVFGSTAHVEICNSTHPDTPGGTAEMVLTRTGQSPVTTEYEWTDTVAANVEAWAELILTGKPYVHTTSQMIHNIEVLTAIAHAAETHSFMHLEG